jgi:hypothetical protein
MGSDVPEMIAAPDRCNSYCCSAFANFPDHFPESESLCDLNNPIHPIFRNMQLPPDVERRHIEPSLRLATLLISSHPAAEYIQTIMDNQLIDLSGKRSSPPELTFEDERGNVHYRHARVYPIYQYMNMDKMALRADTILRDMAKMISFDISGQNICCHQHARCDFNRGPLPEKLFKKFPYGCRSVIYVNPRNLRLLAHLEKEEPSPQKNGEILRIRFELATTLTHELAHAFNQAAFGLRDNEFFYRDTRMSEAGHTFVSVIFGGIPVWQQKFYTPYLPWREWEGRQDCEKSKARHKEGPFVTMKPWPSNALLMDYTSKNSMIATVNFNFLHWDIMRRISSEFIRSLFTQHFWRVEYPKRLEEKQLECLFPDIQGTYPFGFHADGATWPLPWPNLVWKYGLRRAHGVLLCPDCPLEGREGCEYYPPNYPTAEAVLESTDMDWFYESSA